jgi:hypothetical protein
MPTYANGYIPLDLLVVFDRGWNSTDGNWYHALSPATLARHLALQARAAARRIKAGLPALELQISRGWSAYRPYAAQLLARKIHGNWAAVPGTSSHGGSWEGKQTLAMDYSNWAAVYKDIGGLDAFAADCRAVGLSPLLIVPERGYPYEPWHVNDLNPWSAVPAFGDVKPFPIPVATPVPESEEDDMLYLHVGGDKPFFTVLNTNSNVYFPPVTGNAPAAWTIAWGAPKKATVEDFNALLSTVWTVTGQQPYQGTERKVSG